MFRSRKEERERFKTYYERKRNRKFSLFGAAKEAYGFIITMMIGMLPGLLFPLYMEPLGHWWWIFLLSYCACLSAVTYAVYRYREITEIRGFFTKEEFEKEFKNELWMIYFMDRVHILIH